LQLRNAFDVHTFPFPTGGKPFAAISRELEGQNVMGPAFPSNYVRTHFPIIAVVITGDSTFLIYCIDKQVGVARHG
jgi:hypothetical protein